MLPSHGRFRYRPIVGRPPFAWPGGRRLAVYFALCVEHFSYGAGLGLALSPGLSHPNSYNWGWREYGNRVGGWRLIELFDRYGLPMSVLLNTACYEHCPDLVAAFRQRGDEIVAHGRTNSEHQNGMTEDDERTLIRDVTEAIRKHEGTPPKGWMSPGAHPSALTEDLLAEAGYSYTLDWPMDDQPVWMKTRAGPLLSVPYPHEVNDVPMIVLHDGSAPDFADMAIDNFDEMLEQSRAQPLALGITIHTFIVGQPFRIRQFRRVLDHMTGSAGDVWFTTAGAIADHYRGLFPAPAEEGLA
jgi:peptidoglycan/xylan/chitin deacetylase (PgdA/CDA1 family)